MTASSKKRWPSSSSSSRQCESDQVMNCRGGSVLGKKTILKSDHFPGCQNKCLTPQIDGAPNYRQGINRARLEQMEFRLKEDILLEAVRYGNEILVTDEQPDGQMVDQWEPLTHDSIKTPFEVYEELQKEGYLVDYERIPITDEKSPKEGDFDDLVHIIPQVNLDTEILFNCQMGRGRTTTGMVIATLLYLNQIGASGIPQSTSIGKIFASSTDVTDHLSNSEESTRGEYAVIRSLIRVLEGGAEAKKQVDKVIDICDSMQVLLDLE